MDKSKNIATFYLLCLSGVLLITPAHSLFNDTGFLPMDDFYSPGDLVLGAIVRLYFSKPGEPFCSTLAHTGVQVAAAIMYSIEQINDDPKILTNIKLGYALLNDCDRGNVALARSTKFLPLNQCVTDGCSVSTRDGMIKDRLVQEYYNVVGVMGPYSSSSAVPVASLLSVYKVPVMSWSASSAELSDKEKFSYFSRTIPADDSAVDAAIAILLKFGWTYVSVLYVEGSYGTSASRIFRKKIKGEGICLAYEKELGSNDDDSTYAGVIRSLRNQTQAKVVVLFIDGHTADALIQALHDHNASTEFIFIGTEGFQPRLSNAPKVPLSALCITIHNPDPEFTEYYKKLNALRTRSNPWLGEYTQEELNCTTDTRDRSGREDCDTITLGQVDDFKVYNGIGRVTNIVKTYALALDKHIQDHCPSAMGAALQDCIKGELLLSYMRNVTFKGPRFNVSYDEQGDVYGKYDIIFSTGVNSMTGHHSEKDQANTTLSTSEYRETIIGSWERLTKMLIVDTSKLPWEIIEDEELGGEPDWQKQKKETKGRKPLPESICAHPCRVGEYKIKGEVSCCWTCAQCRSNEIIIDDDPVRCETCKLTQWPRPPFRNECEIIPPTYMQYTDPYALALMTFALIGLTSVLVLVFILSTHWERKVIKGSSRELMVTIVIGLSLAYLTVYALIAKPTQVVCILNYAGFNISCSLMFGPLFLKTLRLHLIFQASERFRSRVKRVDRVSLMTALFIILLVQVVLMVVVGLIDPIKVQTTMKIPTEKSSVELYCFIPLPVLLTPLSYNILLLFLCGVYGFLTRKLPENYNESWYIFIAVTTTLFVWTACIPTYFITFYFYHKAALLSMALVVNGLVISLCLFSPKIYALYFVDEKDIKITHMSSRRYSQNLATVGFTTDRQNSRCVAK